jgi:hypothetical protein
MSINFFEYAIAAGIVHGITQQHKFKPQSELFGELPYPEDLTIAESDYALAEPEDASLPYPDYNPVEEGDMPDPVYSDAEEMEDWIISQDDPEELHWCRAFLLHHYPEAPANHIFRIDCHLDTLSDDETFV